MSRRHGRAVMPFGKHKGVRLRLLPDGYLSWLTTIDLSRWQWIKESLRAELEYRGMRADLMDTVEPVIDEPVPPVDAGGRVDEIVGKLSEYYL